MKSEALIRSPCSSTPYFLASHQLSAQLLMPLESHPSLLSVTRKLSVYCDYPHHHFCHASNVLCIPHLVRLIVDIVTLTENAVLWISANCKLTTIHFGNLAFSVLLCVQVSHLPYARRSYHAHVTAAWSCLHILIDSHFITATSTHYI